MSVYGQSPDVDFLFKIPASGERPMTFSAKGLPKGLKLDPETGIISGRARKAGSYNVTLTATNSLGSDSKPLRLEIGEDKLLLTPPPISSLRFSEVSCSSSLSEQASFRP